MGSDGKRKPRWGLVVPEDIGFGDMPELTEPIIIPRVVVSGTHVVLRGEMVLIDGWEDLQTINGAEKRCVGRGAMTVETARDMIDQLMGKMPPKR
jgi:hypothetical protein